MTKSPRPYFDPTNPDELAAALGHLALPVGTDTAPIDLQTTRILINTYGASSVVGVLHAETGLTDATWDNLIQASEALWSDLVLTDVPQQEDVTRANRDNLFTRQTLPGAIREKIETAWYNDDRLAIIEILAAHRKLEVCVMGGSAWGVSSVYF